MHGKEHEGRFLVIKLDVSLVQGKSGKMWTWSKAQPLATAGQKGLAGGAGLRRADR